MRGWPLTGQAIKISQHPDKSRTPRQEREPRQRNTTEDIGIHIKHQDFTKALVMRFGSITVVLMIMVLVTVIGHWRKVAKKLEKIRKEIWGVKIGEKSRKA